jgi:hypothetical protein
MLCLAPAPQQIQCIAALLLILQTIIHDILIGVRLSRHPGTPMARRSLRPVASANCSPSASCSPANPPSTRPRSPSAPSPWPCRQPGTPQAAVPFPAVSPRGKAPGGIAGQPGRQVLVRGDTIIPRMGAREEPHRHAGAWSGCRIVVAPESALFEGLDQVVGALEDVLLQQRPCLPRVALAQGVH